MGLTAFGVGKTLDNMFVTQGHDSSYHSDAAALWGKYIYIGLFNGDPAGNDFTEVSGAGYKRISIGAYCNANELAFKPIVCHFCACGAFTANQIENVNAITFDYAEENWGTVTHFGIFGSNSNDPTVISDHNLILSGQFTNPITISQGHIATFKKRSGTTAGAFTISMS